MADHEIMTLTEYAPRRLPADALSMQAGTALWQRYGQQVSVEFPSPKTEDCWQLIAQGWVGAIPLSRTYTLLLYPRIPLSNLFGMLEYAFDLKSFHLLDGNVALTTLAEFYERLALVLARRVLDRSRQGLIRAYVGQTARTAAVRGHIDTDLLARQPWQVYPTCTFSEHTTDNEANQILVWTLFTIIQSGLCTARTLPVIRQAYRVLRSAVPLQPISPMACDAQSYHRLNADYRPLHTLCRFFLEQTGPGYLAGDHQMLPFLVDMARLYEQFVAAWLRAHLPPTLTQRTQEQVRLDDGGGPTFLLDIVLSDTATGAPRVILDTKYKDAATPGTADITQVVAYAAAKDCHDAVLVYPTTLTHPLDVMVGDIHVRSATFSLSDDIEVAGQMFLRDVLG